MTLSENTLLDLLDTLAAVDHIIICVANGTAKVLKHVDAADRLNTFKMGYGWVVIVPAAQKDAALACGLKGQFLGTITADHGVKVG